MKIQTRPWAIATGSGVVIQLVLGLVLSGLTNLVFQRLAAESQMAVTEIGLYSMGLGAAQLCLCGSAYGLLVGAVYTLTLPRDEYFTATESALGGSLSAATASVAAGALSMFLSLMVLIAQIGPQMGDPAALATLVMTQLLAGLGGLLLGGLVALVMGAVGGGLTLSVTRREK